MAVIPDMPIADWLILAALAIVIAVTRMVARRHPKIPPALSGREDDAALDGPRPQEDLEIVNPRLQHARRTVG